MATSQSLVPAPRGPLVADAAARMLLDQVRPAWRAKSLIQRVERLLPVDLSSACQRLLNAALHDLREKIVLAGIDIAREVATDHKLPPVLRDEDVLDTYSASNVLSLAYRMGLLTRAEWRRLSRAYDIRRDLEHEDDEYEAAVEDAIYVFKTCIEIVLAQDPVELLRVSDVREIVEAPDRAAPSLDLLADFESAPKVRQTEISRYLIQTALDDRKPEIVRQNAVEMLRNMEPRVQAAAKLDIAKAFRTGSKRESLGLARMKVAAAIGVVAYLRQAQVRTFFRDLLEEFERVGPRWTAYGEHGDLLDEFEDVGGLLTCSPKLRGSFVTWLVLCYIGEAGERGTFGRNRKVFYSNSGASRACRLLEEAGRPIADDLTAAAEDPRVVTRAKNQHVSRRLEDLLDLVADPP